MKEELVELLEKSIDICFEKGALKRMEIPFIEVDLPREDSHGDYASNIAMILASNQRENPRKIAGLIIDNIEDNNIVEKIEIADPGFINFFIRKEMWT
ncbi:MAG: arginine--tRNA ligase, partial [Syntrophaceae bacterium]|nr:arginine--tRNA ligase [Syntrophaceae bacterium]